MRWRIATDTVPTSNLLSRTVNFGAFYVPKFSWHRPLLQMQFLQVNCFRGRQTLVHSMCLSACGGDSPVVANYKKEDYEKNRNI